ncbi:hypothetical protein J7M23_00965 [Candidatus Sumerlaeota bacterium]|nr:hypothetical protein [Candidatus Sumerlaeota bacterium]
MKKVSIPLILLSIMIASGNCATENTTETLNLIKAHYEKFRNTSWKLTYVREMCVFLGHENIVETLPDGKVVVEVPGSYVRVGKDPTTPAKRNRKTVSIDPQYNRPVIKTVAVVTSWIKGKKFYLERQEDFGGTTYECYDGDTYKQLMENKTKTIRFGFIMDEKKVFFDTINSLLQWYNPNWMGKLGKNVRVVETDKNVTIIDEVGHLQKVEILLDKTAGFMPRRYVYSVDGIVHIETQYEGTVLIDGVYLPRAITKKTFKHSPQSPRVFSYYKDITWEKASPKEFDSKLSFSFPEDTIIARKSQH